MGGLRDPAHSPGFAARGIVDGWLSSFTPASGSLACRTTFDLQTSYLSVSAVTCLQLLGVRKRPMYLVSPTSVLAAPLPFGRAGGLVHPGCSQPVGPFGG